MKKFVSILALLALTSLVACGASPSENSEVASEDNESLQIVASFYPLAYFADYIVGEKAEVIDLVGNKGVHGFDPSPQDLINLQEADLVLYQGAGLEAWTDDLIPQLEANGIKTVEVSDFLELEKTEEHDAGHEDEHHEDEHHEDENHEHDHGEFDPHTWLDPVLAQEMLEVVSESIIELDPENAEFYEANTNELKEKLAAFDSEFKNNLQSCEYDEVIVSHDAFGYMAKRYDIHFHAIAGLSNNDEPSAKILAELKEEALEGIAYILTEENNVKRFAETLAEETGLQMLPVNTLGSNDKDFLVGFEENIKNFKTAFGCQ